jgi:hypothetical protein
MGICKCEGRFEPKSLGTPGLENQYFPTSQESISILLKRSELDNRNISHVVSKVHLIYAMVMTLTPQYYPSSHKAMSHVLDRRVTESDKFPEAKKTNYHLLKTSRLETCNTYKPAKVNILL